MKIGITFDYIEKYLPTKRHRTPQPRRMTTCRDIELRYIEEKDFPVAMRVTDFEILPHDLASETDDGYDTIEYRWDGKDLYREPRYVSGSEKGELEYKSDKELIETISHSRSLYIYSYEADCEPGKEYVEGVSVYFRDDCDKRLADMQFIADQHVICNGKVWEKCGQPYYYTQTFGCGHNHGGTSFFIGWTNEEFISKDNFLATQKDLAVKDFNDTANGRGDTESVKQNKTEKRHIEIIIPDSYTLKRQLESYKIKGYMWSDDKGCFIKEYGSETFGTVYHIRFRHDYGDRCLAVVHVDGKHDINKVWQAVGQVMADFRKLSFEDISEIYCVDLDRDVLRDFDDMEACA